jgi:hypothetical protein
MSQTGPGWCKFCHIPLFWDKRPGKPLLPYEDSTLTVQHKCVDYQKRMADAGHYQFKRAPEIDAQAIKELLKRIEMLEALITSQT